METATRIIKKLNKLWKRSQFPSQNPIQISTIDKLIIFLICIVISIISSYEILLVQTLEGSDFLSWGINFSEVLFTCGFLILVSRKENPNINSRQILLIISLLLVVQMIKNIFGSGFSPLSIIIPPALIISQGMGTITALAWVSIASLSWPDSLTNINSNLLLITLICACVVSVLGGRIRSRAQLLQLSIFVPIGALISQWLLIGNEKYSLIDNQEVFTSNGGGRWGVLSPIVMTTLTKASPLQISNSRSESFRNRSRASRGIVAHHAGCRSCSDQLPALRRTHDFVTHFERRPTNFGNRRVHGYGIWVNHGSEEICLYCRQYWANFLRFEGLHHATFIEIRHPSSLHPSQENCVVYMFQSVHIPPLDRYFD